MVHTIIIGVWMTLLFITLSVVFVYMFKKPKHNINEVFEQIFKKQVDLLKKIDEENTMQVEVFDKLNHNIVENYRILLQIQIKESIKHNPFETEHILKLYNDYIGIAKYPNTVLDDAVNEWRNLYGY